MREIVPLQRSAGLGIGFVRAGVGLSERGLEASAGPRIYRRGLTARSGPSNVRLTQESRRRPEVRTQRPDAALLPERVQPR